MDDISKMTLREINREIMMNYYDIFPTERGNALIDEFNRRWDLLSDTEKEDITKYSEELDKERDKNVTPEMEEKIRMLKW